MHKAVFLYFEPIFEQKGAASLIGWFETLDPNISIINEASLH